MKEHLMPERLYVYKADNREARVPFKAYKADGKPDPEDVEYVRADLIATSQTPPNESET